MKPHDANKTLYAQICANAQLNLHRVARRCSMQRRRLPARERMFARLAKQLSDAPPLGPYDSTVKNNSQSTQRFARGAASDMQISNIYQPRFSNMKEPYSVCYVQREAWSAAINAPERRGGRRSGALSLLHHPVRDKNKMCRIARQVSLCVYCRILFKKSNLRAKMTTQQQSRASWYELGGCSGSTA